MNQHLSSLCLSITEHLMGDVNLSKRRKGELLHCWKQAKEKKYLICCWKKKKRSAAFSEGTVGFLFFKQTQKSTLFFFACPLVLLFTHSFVCSVVLRLLLYCSGCLYSHDTPKIQQQQFLFSLHSYCFPSVSVM